MQPATDTAQLKLCVMCPCDPWGLHHCSALKATYDTFGSSAAAAAAEEAATAAAERPSAIPGAGELFLAGWQAKFWDSGRMLWAECTGVGGFDVVAAVGNSCQMSWQQ